MGNSEQLVTKYDDLAQISSQLSKLTDAITSTPRAYPEGTIDWRGFRQKLGTHNEAIAERRFRRHVDLDGGAHVEHADAGAVHERRSRPG